MRTIDADALKDDINVYFADSYHLIDSIEERIDAAPTVESEIICCKDCVHWFDIDDGRQIHTMCASIDGDWFCGDAKRRR